MVNVDKKLIKELLYKHYGIEAAALQRLSGHYDANFKVSSRHGFYFLKIYGGDKLKAVQFQTDLIDLYLRKGLPVAGFLPTSGGKKYFKYAKHFAILQKFISGEHIHDSSLNPALMLKLGRTLGKMHRFAESSVLRKRGWKKYVWDLSQFHLVAPHFAAAKKFLSKKEAQHVAAVLEQLKQKKKDLQPLRKGPTHNDFHGKNIIIKNSEVAGIFDFGDALNSWYAADLATALESLSFGKKAKASDLAGHFFAGYSKQFKLRPAEKNMLVFLIKLRAAAILIELNYHFKNKTPKMYREFISEAARVLDFFADPQKTKEFSRKALGLQQS